MVELCVVCRYHPNEFCTLRKPDSKDDVNDNGNGNGSDSESLLLEGRGTSSSDNRAVLDESSARNDGLDDFNHPRQRRALILLELQRRETQTASRTQMETDGTDGTHRGLEAVTEATATPTVPSIVFETPTSLDEIIERKDNDDNHNDNHNYNYNYNHNDPLHLYRKVHSDGLIDFLSTAWERWVSLGASGRDLSCVPVSSLLMDDDHDERAVPPMIPCNFSLPREFSRDHYHHPQRASKNVMGQIGYYCTDTCTPIVSGLVEELAWDATTVSLAVDRAIGKTNIPEGLPQCRHRHRSPPAVYALCTHPGHHAARDSFGGYCYVNNAALAARLLLERLPSKKARIAILDVDYHCGNGTASIFYDDPDVLVVSIHCHPDFEYPFHSGFGDETGGPNAPRATLHLPLAPGATWEDHYEPTLSGAAQEAIVAFGPDAVVISLGLDTHASDPCATRRAGFELRSSSRVGGNINGNGDINGNGSVDDPSDSDYYRMGIALGSIVALCGKQKRGNGNGNGDDDGNDDDDEAKASTETVSVPVPAMVLQEGGYAMEAVPSAAADVLLGMAAAMDGGSGL